MQLSKRTQMIGVTASICAMNLLMLYIMTSSNIVIAPIAHDFQVKITAIQWFFGGYLLATALFMILAGRLADLYGQRRFYLIGIFIITLFTFLLGFAANKAMLIGFRILEGIGYSIFFPVMVGIIFTFFPAKYRAHIIAIALTFAGLAAATGPILTGYFLQVLNWRWVYFIFSTPGIAAFIFAYIFLPQDTHTAEQKIDYLGTILLIIAVVLIILALIKANDWKMTSLLFWSVLIGGLVILVIFCGYELKHKDPLVDFNLFRIHNFLLGNICRIPVGYIFFGVLFILGLFLQNVLGKSPIDTGLIFLALMVPFAIISSISEWIIKFIGLKATLLLSLSCYAIACSWIALFPTNPSILSMISSFAIIGIASGLALASTLNISISCVQPEKTNVASGILYTNNYIISALATAITGLINILAGWQYGKYLLIQHNIFLPPDLMSHFERFASGAETIHAIPIYFAKYPEPLFRNIIQTAFVHAMSIAFWICFGLALLGIISAIFIKKEIPKDS